MKRDISAYLKMVEDMNNKAFEMFVKNEEGFNDENEEIQTMKEKAEKRFNELVEKYGLDNLLLEMGFEK